MQTSDPASGIDASIAVFDAGIVAIESVALPERRQGEVDLSITAAAICGSDLHTVLGHRSSPDRTALGHEGVGRVIDADGAASDLRGEPLRPGDRVVFGLYSSCGSCDRCDNGLAMKCRSLLKYGHESVSIPPHATGTLASHVRLLPGVPMLRIPDEIPDANVVSAGCAVATAAEIVQCVKPVPEGTRVLVLGVGAVGAYCVAMLVGAGCSVWVQDPSPARSAFAVELGAEVSPPPGDFAVVVEAAGSDVAVVAAIDAAAVGGRVVLAGSVSPGNGPVTVDPARIVTHRLSLVGIHNYSAESFVGGVDWLLDHSERLELERLVSPPVALAVVQKGFEQMQDGQFHRVLVTPNPLDVA